jgi:cytochrome oxidase Cu insertion factor (SCO1/SenC/PrrC family)
MKAKGALAPFAIFSLALTLASEPALGADTATPTVSGLPAPGTYALQRIQRVPEAQLLDADDRPTALSVATRGAITALAFFYGHCVDPAAAPSRGRRSKHCKRKRRAIRFCVVA